MKLENVTLLITDCLNLERAIAVVERCKAQVEFSDIKLLTHFDTDYPHAVKIPQIENLITYSVFMLKKAHEYINTKSVLVVQRDGWIINANSWEDDWFNYDYMGPLFNQVDIQGVGGFSFRSKKLMESVSSKYPEWKWTNESTNYLQNIIGIYEDGAIAMSLRKRLEKEGFKFPSLEVAARFAQGGNPNPKYHYDYPFGFHGGWKNVDVITGYVSPEIKHDGIIPELL